MHRLFVYGSLAPGRPNAHVLADVAGDWEPATVTGKLLQEGWGAAVGYPGIVLGEGGGEVEGLLFSSEQLAGCWARLDAFEGEGYERVPATVKRGDGTTVDAHLYALRGGDRRPIAGNAASTAFEPKLLRSSMGCRR
jgi:gamma-glutamylcyclotransferase (GGCT)/AIG2-like uncharacterized protein YtfP